MEHPCHEAESLRTCKSSASKADESARRLTLALSTLDESQNATSSHSRLPQPPQKQQYQLPQVPTSLHAQGSSAASVATVGSPALPAPLPVPMAMPKSSAPSDARYILNPATQYPGARLATQNLGPSPRLPSFPMPRPPPNPPILGQSPTGLPFFQPYSPREPAQNPSPSVASSGHVSVKASQGNTSETLVSFVEAAEAQHTGQRAPEQAISSSKDRSSDPIDLRELKCSQVRIIT